jgi:imidazolonepropionase-like amidohydrolase
MLIHQALVEARTPNMMLMHDDRLLTPLGRQVLLDFLKDGRPLVMKVDRASDIRQVLAFAKREQLPNVVITGGAEGWRVAPELAAAKVTVVVDPLANLPQNFDAVGATLENAARLHAAGVEVAFMLANAEPFYVRKLREAAGVAVAYGLPWDAALAAITRVPAEAFGVADRVGVLETGRPADLVLWSGDPLEVTTWAEKVWIGGRAQPERSRQTELRDRYLEKLRRGDAR